MRPGMAADHWRSIRSVTRTGIGCKRAPALLENNNA